MLLKDKIKDDSRETSQVWDLYWKRYRGVTKIGIWSQKKALQAAFDLIKKEKLAKDSQIIDIGCGEGRTLQFFIKNGFTNSIGIDSSKHSLEICEKNGLKKGKNIFIMEAAKTKFKSSNFELVFSEGLLEHFQNPESIIKEMCRISNKYVLLIQPNHYSLFGQMVAMFGPFLRNNVKEYTFSEEYFINKFSKENFHLKSKILTPLKEFFILLFQR